VKQRLARILAGFVITLFFIGHAAELYRVGFIDRLENIIYDSRLRMTLPDKADPRIVILDIDEKSLGEVGRWPWNRALMASLVDKLFAKYGVRVLGFDVVWAEPDQSSGREVLDALSGAELKDDPRFAAAYRRLRPRLDYDALFAASMQNRPVVLGYYLSNSLRANALPDPVLPGQAFAGRDAPITRWTGYTGNLSVYMRAAAAAGHFNPIVDDDGIVRRVPLLAELDGAYYESFSLALARTWLALEDRDHRPPAVHPGFPQSGAQGGYSRLEWLSVGRLTIPVDEQAAALVPYAGRRGVFEYVSLADVLADRIPHDRLKGRLAIVGASAPALLDLRSTPVENVYPGVEICANLVAGMLNAAIKMRPGYTLGAEVAFLFVGGLVLSLLIPVLSAAWATAATALGLALITGLGLVLWSDAGIVLPLASSILMTVSLYTMNMAYGYFVETRTRRQVAARFGEYVPPEVVEQILSDPVRYSMEPRAAELTILFADVRGFTGISEALAPEELREYINQYLTDMSRIIRAGHRGTLDKYIGDAIMAFWGAPVEDPQHARNGVLAALEMQRECKVLNKKLTGRGWPALEIGVGVNTGNVRVGDMGSQARRAYTAMGDAVNVASRLEARTQHYGVGILAGEATRAAAKDVVFREVDRVKVKGRDTALTVYEPIGPENELSAERRSELRRWDEALAAYRACAWDVAAGKLEALRHEYPGCSLYGVFAARVAQLRRNPPSAGWDGVTVFAEK